MFLIPFFLEYTVFLVIFSSGCYSSENDCSYKADIKRKIDALGFHRNIYYNISLETNCKVNHCKLCLQETLPSGMFVNKDQLQDFFRLGKLVASADGIVDIETPANVSPQLIVRILSEVSNELYEGKVILPVHTRYQSPQPGGGFKTVTIDKPELYIHCGREVSNIKGEVFLTPCAGQENIPLPFYKLPYTIAEEDAVLTVEVPVGDCDSFLLVQTATIGVTIIGALYIMGVILKI